MNHQVGLLLRKFCNIKGESYNIGKRIYMEMTKQEKAQMVTAMKRVVESNKVKKVLQNI